MSAVCGSCPRGGVKYEITGPLMRPLNCHCSLCRKQQGAAFRSRARVRRSDFKWIQGEKLLTYYEATPGYRRGFCRVCGSPILNRAEPYSRLAKDHPQTLTELGIALGVLDGDPGVRPESHIFVSSKARGSRLPTICRNSPSCRLRPRTAAGRGGADGRRGRGAGPIQRSDGAAERPYRG